jgi:hypothetical protein
LPRLRGFATFAACLALAVGVAACGGGDGGGGSADEDAITSVIETASTSTDPADCSKLQTDKSLEQTELTFNGETALESCEKDAPDGSTNPDSVDVTDVSVDGDSATADVTFSGGPSDGSTYSLALLKDGDQWKLDEITDIPELNLDALRAGLAEQVSASDDVPPDVATCVLDAFNSATEEQVKSLILSGSEDEFLSLIGDCLPSS